MKDRQIVRYTKSKYVIEKYYSNKGAIMLKKRYLSGYVVMITKHVRGCGHSFLYIGGSIIEAYIIYKKAIKDL